MPLYISTTQAKFILLKFLTHYLITNLSAWFQTHNSHSIWDHHPLPSVIWRRTAFKCLQTLQGSFSSLCLVWKHACYRRHNSKMIDMQRESCVSNHKFNILHLIKLFVSWTSNNVGKTYVITDETCRYDFEMRVRPVWYLNLTVWFTTKCYCKRKR